MTIRMSTGFHRSLRQDSIKLAQSLTAIQNPEGNSSPSLCISSPFLAVIQQKRAVLPVIILLFLILMFSKIDANRDKRILNCKIQARYHSYKWQSYKINQQKARICLFTNVL